MATRKQSTGARRVRVLLWILLAVAVVAGALRATRSERRPGLSPPDRRGWGHPGAIGSAEGAGFKAQETVLIRSHGVQVRVNRRAAPLFKGFLDELGDGGYVIRQRDTGGYNHRFKNCAEPSDCEGQLSHHSWGTALDVNWTSNPLGTHDGCAITTDLPEGIRTLAERWGLRWGGDFSCSAKDPMHFEVIGRPEDTPVIIERNTNG